MDMNMEEWMHVKRKSWPALILTGLILAGAACGTSNEAPAEDTAAPSTVAKTSSDGVLLFDDFSNPGSGWPIDDTYYFRGYDEGAYRIRIDQDENPYIFPLAVSGHSFGDVRVEVDTERVSGSESAGAYLICRYQDNDNYYYAELDGDGMLSIGAYLEDEQVIVVDDFPSGVAPSQNHFELDCTGTEMVVYLDGVQFLYAAQLEIPTGDVGFGAGGSGSGVTEVLFDNFMVSQP
jgi:hypothetical protein